MGPGAYEGANTQSKFAPSAKPMAKKPNNVGFGGGQSRFDSAKINSSKNKVGSLIPGPGQY